MTEGRLRIGTRGSLLALTQAEMFRSEITKANPQLETEEVVITTNGDRGAVPDAKAGLKGLFTKEIENALLNQTVDVAVHSLKDLPGTMADGLVLAAVLERAPVNDLLIVKRRPVQKVGTSSVRRKHMIEWMFPGVEAVAHRGNVPTRVEKLHTIDELDAIILAEAGLKRLGINLKTAGFEVEPLDMIPAIGQGAIGLQARADDLETIEILKKVNHEPTFRAVRAERELLRLLQGDCSLPVGARATLDGDQIKLEAILFGENPKEPKRVEVSGTDPEAVGQLAFQELSRA